MDKGIIDAQGFRSNVGIVLLNQKGKLWWGRRVGNRHAWQFPQGGLLLDESPELGMYRELAEELGLKAGDVECLVQTANWLSYRLPERFRRHQEKPLCVGQKQRWFLLRLLSGDDAICLDRFGQPEFDRWRWVDYWYPLEHVIVFKRDVYRAVLEEFESMV